MTPRRLRIDRWLAPLGLLAALLLGRAPAPAAPAPPADDLAADYARHLRETKGILDIRALSRSGEGPCFIDLVIVSAGFPAGQMGEFHRLCERLASGLLAQPPWNRYKGLFNVHAVFVGDESPDSTRLKVQGYKGNVLSCDNGIAIEYSRYAAPSKITLVIHNSGFSTPANGYWGVAVHHKGAAVEPDASTHEVGHGFAGLGDEYIQRNTPFEEDPSHLRDSVNVTAEENPRLSTWHYWLEETWPGLLGPQRLPPGTRVVNAEGAGWVKGAYRSEASCVMRGDSHAYCVVCNETLEANFFRYIDLFRTAEPAGEDLVLWQGESVDVRLGAIDLVRQPPDWLKSRLDLHLDGEPVAASDRGEVAWTLRNAAPGVHQLGASLTVQAERVRRDFGFLSRNTGWRVTVLPCARPRIALKPAVTVPPDGALDVTVAVEHATPALFTLKMANAPAGAVLEKGRFTWKPGGRTGSWRVDFTALHGQQPGATESMEIQVAAPGRAGAAPEVQPPGVQDVVTGKAARLQLKASAPDGGHLLFEPVQVPAGVELNRETGELAWTPVPAQGGPQRARLRVKNGTAAREVDVVFRVRREATPSPIFAPYRERTVEALDQLRQHPGAYRRLFEPLRLLRDRFEPVYAKAMAVADATFQELDPRLRAHFLQELEQRAWDFTFKPEILKWMRGLAAADPSKAAAGLRKRLDEVDAYNAGRLRQAAAEAARRKQERQEAMTGVIAEWQVSRIYRYGNQSGGELVASVFPPEQGPAPDAGWAKAACDRDGVLNISGFLEKAKVPGPYTRCAVYLRATVEVPSATEALLEMGSDDGIKVWINGREAFAHPVSRPLTIGQDKAKVRLDKGVNILLVKITQDHSGWEAHVRVRAADGAALPGLKAGLPP